MPLLDAYLVQGHQHDLLRAAAGTRRFQRTSRPGRPRLRFPARTR